MDKINKLERLLDIYGSQSVKFEELSPALNEESKKVVDEYYEKLMKTRKKIIDLFLE